MAISGYLAHCDRLHRAKRMTKWHCDPLQWPNHMAKWHCDWSQCPNHIRKANCDQSQCLNYSMKCLLRPVAMLELHHEKPIATGRNAILPSMLLELVPLVIGGLHPSTFNQ